MLDIPAVYISVNEAVECIPELEDKSFQQIKDIIVKAQLIIDKEIGFCGTKEDPDQCFIFPTCEDGIPKKIQLAMIELIKLLCKEEAENSGGDDGGSSNGCGCEGECDNGCGYGIKSIKVGDVTTTFMDKKCDENSTEDNYDYNWKTLICDFTGSTIFTNRKLKISCKPKCKSCRNACQCETSTK